MEEKYHTTDWKLTPAGAELWRRMDACGISDEMIARILSVDVNIVIDHRYEATNRYVRVSTDIDVSTDMEIKDPVLMDGCWHTRCIDREGTPYTWLASA